MIHCKKCLSIVVGKGVRDVHGNIFCDRDCRKDWWSENRKENDDLYNWWSGRDSGGN